jgi:hypothetical protein
MRQWSVVARRQTTLTHLLPAEEHAIESVVSRYQRVAPAVTRFARSLARNDELKVTLGPDAASSNGEIVLNPATFQAAYARQAPVTPDEVALASALHEVVHLIATDLTEPRPIPARWGFGVPGETMDLLDALAPRPDVETLFFALEDARQERIHLGRYPGAFSVLEDLYGAASRPALETASPVAQFSLACFLLAGRYTTELPVLHSKTTAALEDAQPLLDRVAEVSDPWDVADLAVRIAAIALEHGLITRGNLSEATALKEGVDSVRLHSPVVEDAEGYGHTRDAAEARAGMSGRKAPVQLAGEASTDQLLRVSQAPTVYLPTGQGGKLIVAPFPDRFRSFAAEGRAAVDHAARRWAVTQRHVSGELYPLFVANQRRGVRAGFDAGDLSPYAALLLGAGLYRRMYERRDLPTRRAYAVSLLIDGSASMLQRSGHWPMAAATLGAWTLARLADELQVEFEIALFNRAFAAKVDDSEASFELRRRRTMGGLRQSRGTDAQRLTNTVNHYLIKTFDEPWRRAEDLLAGLFWTAVEPAGAATAARRDPAGAPPVSLFDKAANVDEYNLIHAADRMGRRRTNVRVLVVLSDGMTRGSSSALASTARDIERSGTTVLGIGIGDATVQDTYGRYELAEQPEQLTRAMVDGVRSALRRSLALWGVDTWWGRAARAKEPTVD